MNYIKYFVINCSGNFWKKKKKISFFIKINFYIYSFRNKSRNSVSIIKYYTSIRLNSTENNIDSSSSYRFYPGKLPIIDITVGKLFEKACKEFKNRECVVSVHQNNIRLTYNQVLERADKLAAGLKKLNLKYGDRVGVWGPNDYQWLLAFIAISRAGCIMVGINPAYQQNELNYCLNKVQVNTVIAPDKFRTQDYGKMLIDAKNTCPSLKNIILWTDNSIK